MSQDRRYIDLTNDSDEDTPIEDEDEDLKRAIALSLQDIRDDTQAESSSDHNKTQLIDVAVQNKNKAGLLALDRKAMETERLARLKRKRDVSEGGERLRGNEISPPPLRRESRDANGQTASIPGTKSNATSPAATSNLNLQYPKGKVFQTPTTSPMKPKYTRDRSISFSSVIDAANLQSCLLSSFIWDFDWLFPHFQTKTTKFMLVMHAKTPFQRDKIISEFEDIPNIRLCFPPMDGPAQCMHSKLMILFYQNRCRIVIPSANLVDFDWGVGSFMENMLWLIDLPLMVSEVQNQEVASPENPTNFQCNLLKFLKAQTVPTDLIEKLNTFSFAETAHLGFVHSIAGTHQYRHRSEGESEQEDWRTTGLSSLSKTVAELDLATQDSVQIDYVTSSLGSLDDEFIDSLYSAARGQYHDEGTQTATKSASSAKAIQWPVKVASRSPAKAGAQNIAQVEDPRRSTPFTNNEQNEGQVWKSNFRIYFPSRATVNASNGGPMNAGTVCFQKKWWNGNKFPRHSMRDCVSIREGMLMHSKIIFVRYMQLKSVKRAVYAGWVYIGSANLSESAWGRLSLNKPSKTPKLSCRNWECGVIIPVTMPTTSGISEHPTEVRDSMDIFIDMILVPMEYPGTPIEHSTSEPWFFGIDH